MVMAKVLGRDLEAAPVPGDAVAGTDHAILLDAEYVFDRAVDIGHERLPGSAAATAKRAL
jgi:hypothetical protein